jgi:hypothetical protein
MRETRTSGSVVGPPRRRGGLPDPIKNSKSARQIKSIQDEVKTYFKRINIDHFLAMMEKILEQLESANLAH